MIKAADKVFLKWVMGSPFDGPNNLPRIRELPALILAGECKFLNNRGFDMLRLRGAADYLNGHSREAKVVRTEKVSP